METLITLHLCLSVFVFGFSMFTGHEDVLILKARGEDYAHAQIGFNVGFFLLIVSFIPILNIALLGVTYLYRKGTL